MKSPTHATPSADHPIVSATADQLGRSRFAYELARAIQRRSGKDSLIVSLEEPWGRGKTSIKNLMLEKLLAKQDSVQAVCEFVPWEVSGEEQLTQAFFEVLGDALERAGDSTRGRVKGLLRKYSDIDDCAGAESRWGC